MTTNDQKIMELKKQIEAKKLLLKSSERFSPITNCSLELDGARYNIHVLTKDKIVPILVKLNTYKKSAEELGILEDYNIGGFNVKDWMADLKAKLDFVSRKEETEKLKKMEDKLHKLLSNDKKVELELEEIEQMLK